MTNMPAYFSEALTAALGLLDEGKDLDADDLMLRHTDQVKSEHGDPSAEYASALFEHGLLLYRANDFECTDFMRVAAVVASKVEGAEQLQGRITITLGDLLIDMEKYSEARDVLLQSVASRAVCYGEGHVEYANALLSLAYAEWMDGDAQGGLAHLEDALKIFELANDVQRFDAATLMSVIHKSLGDDVQTFTRFTKLSTVDLGQLIDQTTNYIERFEWNLQAKVFEELYLTSLDFENALYVQQAALAEQAAFCCKNAGEFARSELYWNAAMAIAERNNDFESLLSLRADLALTLLEAGETDRSETHFIEVMSECQKRGMHGLLSFSLRKYGRLLETAGRASECEQYLRKAIDAARNSSDTQDAGLALAELGVYLHHQSRYGEAEPFLSEARELIRPEHGWHGMVEDHLEATMDEHACGCTDDDEVYECVSDFINESGPPWVEELIGDVRIDRLNQIRVNLRREPSPEEEEALDAFSEELLEKVRQMRRSQKRSL